VLITGQVECVSDFERGFPLQQAHAEHGWEPDACIWGDQAVVCHLKDTGRDTLSSCSHADAINVMPHARRLTGIERIYVFVGGMRLRFA
jgi:7,8-dihydropterin-6-yl-methyl-4-(beta-D-ribofuranosyl)aminobenzene 5'-phosphate synthase